MIAPALKDVKVYQKHCGKVMKYSEIDFSVKCDNCGLSVSLDTLTRK